MKAVLQPASIGAVVLAGGRCSPDLAEATGVQTRALIPFRGRPMVESVLSALKKTPCVGQMVIVGDVSRDLGCRCVPPGNTLLDSIRNGIEALGGDCWLLVSADIPFLTPDAVEEVCEKAVASGAVFCYSIVPAERCQEEFPGVERTIVRIREGRFTGGNLAYVHREFLENNWSRVEEVYRARKSPLKLAAILGPYFLFRLLLCRAAPFTLSLTHAERLASKILGAEVRAVVTQHACVGTDIDTVEHLRALS